MVASLAARPGHWALQAFYYLWKTWGRLGREGTGREGSFIQFRPRLAIAHVRWPIGPLQEGDKKKISPVSVARFWGGTYPQRLGWPGFES